MKRNCQIFVIIQQVLLICCSVFAQSIEFPFSSWICSKGSCEVGSNCGFNSIGSCLILKTNSSATQSVVETPTISQLSKWTNWVVKIRSKCDQVPYFGLGANTQNIRASFAFSEDSHKWRSHEMFMSTYSEHIWDKTLRLGLYSVIGTCFIDKISLVPAEISQFSFDSYGLLGNTEKIFENGTFKATFGQPTIFTNHLRFMLNSTATWDDSHFRIGDQGFILFNHSLNVPFLNPPSIYYQIGYTTGGYVLLESSNDNGLTWTAFANTTGTCTVQKLLPTKDYNLIKLSSFGGSNFPYNYVFMSSVTPPIKQGIIIGREIILTKDHISSASTTNMSVSIGSNIQNQAGSFNSSLPLILNSFSSSLLSIKLKITPEFSCSSMNFPSKYLSLHPYSSLNSNLIYHLAGGRAQLATISVFSNDETSTYFSGTIIFSPIHFLLDSSYGSTIATSGPTTIWWSTSTHQIYEHRAVPIQTTPTITASLARNEKEPIQLVIHTSAEHTPAIINSITSDIPMNPKGEKLEPLLIRREGYMLTTQTGETNNFALLGARWPDYLIPLENEFPYTCPVNTNCPFWVLISVGENVTTGVYTANIIVSGSSFSFTAKLEVTVFNFTLPKNTKLVSWSGLASRTINKYHNLTSSTNAVKESQYNLYLKSIHSHRLSPSNPITFHEPWGTIKNVNGTDHWQFAFSGFETWYKKYFTDEGYGFTTYNGYIMGMNSGSYKTRSLGCIQGTTQKYCWGSAEHTRLFTEYLQALQTLLEKTNMLSKSVFYWFDEPSEVDYDFIKEGNIAIHKAAPKLQRFLTEQPVPSLVSYVDVWCSSWNAYDSEYAHQIQLLGEKVWTYKGLQLDKPATQPRTWQWHTYKEKIQGILNWDFLWWTSNIVYNNTLQDPYEDVLGWSYDPPAHFWGNCEGRLYYPPLNWKSSKTPIVNATPIETIRLELLREGIEDWEYFTLLERMLVDRPNLPREIREQALNLLQIPESIIKNLDFVLEPSEMEERRFQIASIIELVQKTLDEPVQENSNKDDSQVNS